MKKSIATILVLCTMMFAPAKPAQACVVWAFCDGGTKGLFWVLDQAEEITKQTSKALLQVVAIQTVNRFLLKTIGDIAQPFISDYGKYLFTQPKTEAEFEAESQISKLLHGRSSANYTFNTGAVTGNSATDGNLFDDYESHLYQAGVEDRKKKSVEARGVDIADSCVQKEGRVQMFGTAEQPSFNCMSSVFANTYNHPEGMKIAGSALRADLLKRREKAREVKALAGGGAKGEETEDGKVVKPAFSIKKTIEEALSSTLNGITNIKVDHPAAEVIVTLAMPGLLAATNEALDAKSEELTRRAQEDLKFLRKKEVQNELKNQFSDDELQFGAGFVGI